MFKNWLTDDLNNALGKYGTEILKELKTEIITRPFRERFLFCLIQAHTSDNTEDIEVEKRLSRAMKAIFGEPPQKKANARDHSRTYRWMAMQYLIDRNPHWANAQRKRPRSIEKLAYDAAEIFGGSADTLRKAFTKNKRKWLDFETADSPTMMIEFIQRAALYDIKERLELFGIDLFPDD